MADPVRNFLERYLIVIFPIVFIVVGVIVSIAALKADENDGRSVEQIQVNDVGCILVTEDSAIAVDCDW